MRLRGVLAGLIGLTALAVVALGSTASAGPARAGKAGHVKPGLFWVDLSGTAARHPRFVYFTANAGGQAHGVTWKNWGGRRAIGRGVFRDTSPGFPGKPDLEGPAKLVAWKPIRCVPDFGSRKGKVIRVYRHVVLWHPDGKGGRHRDDVSHTAGYLACR